MFSGQIKAENDDALMMQVFEDLGENTMSFAATVGFMPLAVGMS